MRKDFLFISGIFRENQLIISSTLREKLSCRFSPFHGFSTKKGLHFSPRHALEFSCFKNSDGKFSILLDRL